MKKFLLSSLVMAAGIAASAQSPTTITTANNCFPYHNFNTNNEGFSSPSIYSSADDVTFNWDAAAGAEIETSGLTVRSASLISPVYMQTIQGSATVGFRYIAPVGAEYRIRVISGASSPPLEVLASTANGPVWTPLPALSGNICLLLTDADLTTGRLIRYEFTFRLNHIGDVTFDDFATAVQASPLPVTFQGFVARFNTNGSLKLLWNVGEELNVLGYYVESSTNGINFTNHGYITATGKSIYSLDHPKLAQTMFFRIKNVDIDGRSKYSATIKVYAKEQTDAQIQIYPMPASDQVTIQHRKSPENAVITLFAPDGRILQQVNVAPFTFQTQLNIRNLASAEYIVRYDDGESAGQYGKLIKN